MLARATLQSKCCGELTHEQYVATDDANQHVHSSLKRVPSESAQFISNDFEGNNYHKGELIAAM
jgi:hypothetical protein